MSPLEKQLAEALNKALLFLDWVEDAGPVGSGWKSDELKAAIAEGDKALKAAGVDRE